MDPSGAFQLRIARDDLGSPSMRALVALHLAAMRAQTPEGHVFALGAKDLLAPDIRLYAASVGAERVGMAALRRLGPDLGELKSMRTHPDHLRRGVASRLLAHVVAEARSLGLNRLVLETGRGPGFEAAHALYVREGFCERGPFGAYEAGPYNRFFERDL